MKREFLLAALILLCTFASACAEDPSALAGTTVAPPPPPRVLAADYSSTYFENHNLGKQLRPPIAALFVHDPGYERHGERLAANVFEKRLGDFDTSEYFLTQLEARFADSHQFQLTAVKDPAVQQQIIQFVRSDDDAPSTVQLALPGGGTADDVAGFRVVYGLAMRQGMEQFGFHKTYRLFIRLIGMIKDAHTGEVVWKKTILAFGDKGYEGYASSHIDGAEMAATYKDLTTNVIDQAMRSLNGENLPPMPTLADPYGDDVGF